MRRDRGGVLIDGVSFVSSYRSEFNRIIQLRKKRIEARTVLDRG